MTQQAHCARCWPTPEWDMLAEHILGLGFEDVADFAYAYFDASDLNALLNEVPAEILSALEVADHAHPIPAARIEKNIHRPSHGQSICPPS